MVFQNGEGFWKGKRLSEEVKKKMSIAHLGKKWSEERKRNFIGKLKWSEERKRKTSISKKGKYTHPQTEETRKKMSIYFKSHPSPSQFKKGQEHRRWCGGRFLAVKRSIAKRKKCLGYEVINSPFEGSVGHHIDEKHVLFIPRKMHKSIWHSLKKPETMERINSLAYNWILIGEQEAKKK